MGGAPAYWVVVVDISTSPAAGSQYVV